MCFIHTGSGTVTYETVRKAMGGDLYPMSLTDTKGIRAVVEAVNQGIDSHLEACSCPDRGDRFDGGKRTVGKLTVCRTLECSVSPKSLPILLRRLFELDTEKDIADAGRTLAGDILLTLGLEEYA